MQVFAVCNARLWRAPELELSPRDVGEAHGTWALQTQNTNHDEFFNGLRLRSLTIEAVKNRERLTLRKIVAAIFLLSSIATAIELILIEHTEDAWQWIPLLLLPAGMFLFVLQIVIRKVAIVWIFRMIMLLCLISGIVGVGLHYKAKVEFKLETNPDLKGWELISESIQGSSLPPVLAPGIMIQIGLLGWAYTYQHPIFHKNRNERSY